MFLKVSFRDDEIAGSFQKSETESSLEKFTENKFDSHATKAQQRQLPFPNQMGNRSEALKAKIRSN